MWKNDASLPQPPICLSCHDAKAAGTNSDERTDERTNERKERMKASKQGKKPARSLREGRDVSAANLSFPGDLGEHPPPLLSPTMMQAKSV